jgi:hypothetical protein
MFSVARKGAVVLKKPVQLVASLTTSYKHYSELWVLSLKVDAAFIVDPRSN